MISLFKKISFEIAPHKLKVFRKYVLYTLLIKILAAVLIAIPTAFHFNGVVNLLKNQVFLTDKYSVESSLILIIILLPAIEEIAFRGWLINSINRTIISLTLFFFYILNFLFNAASQVFQIERLAKFIAIAALLFCLFLVLLRNKESIAKLINMHLSFSAFVSIFSFVVVHISNYKIQGFTTEKLLSLIIILLPYPIFAYLLTDIRIKNGLIWSYALHVFNNSLILIPVIFSGTKV